MNSGDATQRFFCRINKLVYYCGMPSVCVYDFPQIFRKIHVVYGFFLNVILSLFIVSEWTSFYTQQDLSEKQAFDRMVFSFSHPIMYGFSMSTVYYKDTIRDVLSNMNISFVDKDVEKEMLKKCKFKCLMFMTTCGTALVSYGYNGITQTLWSGGSFTTVLTFWPNIKDRSIAANTARVLFYLAWWMLMTKIAASYNLAISMMICCSYQFVQLQKYFYGIGDIFDRKFLRQDQKEKLYEEALVKGIKMHAHLIKYTKLCHLSSSSVTSGQIILNIAVLVLLMLQFMNSEHSFNNALSIFTTGSALLLTTGLFMCTAGDISIEASKVVKAIYCTKWENCQLDSSKRVRRLLVIAMGQAQRPIVLRTLGIIELSYQSYLRIVKSSYSIFSVLY